MTTTSMEVAQAHGGSPAQPLSDDLTFDGQPRCTATSKQSGQRCKRAASPHQHVCANHGAKTPVAKRKVALKLLGYVDRAIEVLATEMETAKDSRDRQAAANSLLDRAGVSRRVEMDDGTARAMLVARIMEMREQALNPPQPEIEALTSADEVVDAEIVDEP